MLDSREPSSWEYVPKWQNCTLLQEIIHGILVSIISLDCGVLTIKI